MDLERLKTYNNWLCLMDVNEYRKPHNRMGRMGVIVA